MQYARLSPTSDLLSRISEVYDTTWNLLSWVAFTDAKLIRIGAQVDVPLTKSSVFPLHVNCCRQQLKTYLRQR
jgi:hypothetical protein